MSFTHTIVHPTDFSEASAPAMEMACALARDQGARLVVVHVLPPPGYHGEVVERRQPDFYDELWQKLREVRPPRDDVRTEHRLLSGDQAEEIVRIAEELKSNLIVMGTHGRTGLRRLLVGSVAEEVMRTAACPVLTVRTSPAGIAEAATPHLHAETPRGAKE
jgi:universal stress protein A